MNKWSVVELWLCTNKKSTENNKRKHIIHDILHIEFHDLKWLCLKENEIDSIEILCRVYTPKIEVFSLGFQTP